MHAPPTAAGDAGSLIAQQGPEVPASPSPSAPPRLSFRRKRAVDIPWGEILQGLAPPTRRRDKCNGPDIRDSLVRAILRDLREVPTLQQEAFEHCGDVAYLRWLVGVLYRVEAKYPSSFRFSAETLVREHRKPAAQAPALKAAV